jgi:hypothetical protein
VREQQWDRSRGGKGPSTPIDTPGRYAWGAAVFGFNPDPWLTVAQVGPGFTNVAYCRSGPGCYDIDREEGAFYERALQEAVASNRTILALETWNELAEGSQIAETVQDGRLYIELTRRYADGFKGRQAGRAPPP